MQLMRKMCLVVAGASVLLFAAGWLGSSAAIWQPAAVVGLCWIGGRPGLRDELADLSIHRLDHCRRRHGHDLSQLATGV